MAFPLKENILNNCRLCQSRCGLIEYITNSEFTDKVFQCTNIKINDESMQKLPKAVCNECKINIETFFPFMQEVKRIDVALRKYLQQEDSDISLATKKTAENKHKCTICNKRYARLVNLKNHKRKHEELFCLKCDVLFDEPLLMKNHKCDANTTEMIEDDMKNIPIEMTDSLHNDEDTTDVEDPLEKACKKGFKCNICKKSFQWKVDLWVHQKNHKNMFTCNFENCNKVCTTAYTLKTHQMKHEGKRPYLCVTCGKGFITKNSLNCHEKIHLEVKAYTCKLCNIGFSVRSNLRAHEKKHHEGVRFYCSQCARAFISKSSLERHERLHTGIREFECGSCPSAFYTRKELVKHQRYHEGLRRYKCNLCFKTFFEKHHLIIHVRTHTGERPYACKIPGCGKSFTESQKLTRHLKARHPPL